MSSLVTDYQSSSIELQLRLKKQFDTLQFLLFEYLSLWSHDVVLQLHLILRLFFTKEVNFQLYFARFKNWN